MKTIKNLLLIVFAYFSSYAQDPQLFENDWYLQKVTIEDVEYFPPINPEVNYVVLSVVENYMSTIVCESIGSSIETITNEFFIVDDFVWVPDGMCDIEETMTFQGVYFQLFFNWQNPNNSYSYNIETGTESFKTLRLTNSDGDVAIYGNEILSNQDFNKLTVTLYPNPATNTLQISIPNSIEIKSVQVFDVLGKKLLESSNVTQIDVSTFTSGLLFVEIETDYGTVIKKVVKK